MLGWDLVTNGALVYEKVDQNNNKTILRPMLTPFSPENANICGTRNLSLLFTPEEIANGTVEPSEPDEASLDQERIDLIKRVYVKHFNDVEQFIRLCQT